MDAQGGDRVAVGPVVVGVDGTPHAMRAVRWAAAEAARLGAPLRLVAAGGLVGEHLPGRVGRRRELESVLARARAAATAVGAGAGTVGSAVRRGDPAAVLVEESQRARLLVVGDRGASRLEGVLAGSVAVAVLRRSACPVVVVRGPERDPAETAGRPVVVGLDATPASVAALDVALDAAAARGVGLVAVRTSDDAAAPDREVAVRAAGRGVPVRTVTGPGPAAGVLLAEAARAQLVVVGSRGRGELAGLVRGSVSTLLVHRAGCPVVVIGPLAAGSRTAAALRDG